MTHDIIIPEHDRFVVSVIKQPHCTLVSAYLSEKAKKSPAAGKVSLLFMLKNPVQVDVNVRLNWIETSDAREWSELIAYACDIADANGGQS